MCKSSRPLVVITPVCISGPQAGPHIAWNKIIQTPSPWLNCENVAFESPISLLRCLNFTYLQVLAAFVSFFHSQMIHVRNIYLHLPQKMAQFCRYIFHTSSIDWVFHAKVISVGIDAVAVCNWKKHEKTRAAAVVGVTGDEDYAFPYAPCIVYLPTFGSFMG